MPIVSHFKEATMIQKHFLMLMAGKDIEYKNRIDVKLTGIAKGVGVEFKQKK